MKNNLPPKKFFFTNIYIMPQIIKLDDFTCSDTTENKYGKFEKINIKKEIKLEDINKNGIVEMNYDIKNNPYIMISSNNKKLILNSSCLDIETIKTDKIIVNNKDMEDEINTLQQKISYLETEVEQLKSKKTVISYNINEEPCNELYLIEFNEANIGIFVMFTLNDHKKYLYICYNIDKNISYWRLVNNIDI